MATEITTIKQAAFKKKVSIHSIIRRPDGGAGLAGQTVKVGGLVKTGREAGKGAFAFIELDDGSCLDSLQLMIYADVKPLHEVTPTGTRLRVEGVLQVPPQDKQRKQRIELRVLKVLHVGSCDSETYPIPKTELKLEGLRDILHLRPRTDTTFACNWHNLFDDLQLVKVDCKMKISAIARIRDELTHATHTFFYDHKFRLVPTPIITSTDCEGAGEMFQVTTLIHDAEKMEKDGHPKPEEGFKMKAGFLPKKDGKVDYGQDFFARQTFLSVSGQLQLEAYACALDNVYTFGPTFRAEHSHTTRHLAEFWMVEPEMADADLEFMVEKYDKNAIRRLQMVASTNFIRISYTEAIKVLEEAVFKGHKFEKKVEWGIDLASEHERYLTEEKFESPVIVYDYPKGIKAFYMKVNPDNKTVAAMDVLVPRVGELIGGSQREEIYDVIKQRMLELGLPLEPYKWYLDLRRYGTVEHSGFGLGFERMVLFATGMDNIKDVIPFPRYPGRADL
ncbi:asparagine--tRNA ligase [Artemisia annua]|uniref:Asparagine--tRNA ligase n=1 Tax=Artemisia annua TaxID=35608 RepID=A0A2U1QA28_ARTAN|nr:asparagine--tRNA ligase [Artemisia annua]